MYRSRVSDDDGATRNNVSSGTGRWPAAAASHGPASSGMMSGRITPAPPAAARSAANRSTPYRSIGFQYDITSVGAPVAATLETVCSTSGVVVPAASAASTASWMVGPSMTGSEYGRPTSTMSAPPSTRAVMAATAPSTDG